MRTTLTLDDDVEALLARVQRLRKKTFKQVVNEALRCGLEKMLTPRESRRSYRTRTANLGRCKLGSLDDVAEALSIAEGESFR